MPWGEVSRGGPYGQMPIRRIESHWFAVGEKGRGGSVTRKRMGSRQRRGSGSPIKGDL